MSYLVFCHRHWLWRALRPALLLAALPLAALGALPGAARATTRTVTNLADSGAGSLRATIAAATDGDTINFAVSGAITLTSGELLINHDLTIWPFFCNS